MSAEPATDEEVPAEDRSRYAGVLRFYELAKRQEWLLQGRPGGEPLQLIMLTPSAVTSAA